MKTKKRTKKLKGGSFLKRLFETPNWDNQRGDLSPKRNDWERRAEEKATGIIAYNNTINEQETRLNEIKGLRTGHSNESPSIYMQNSHGSQTEECFQVPKNTLIIFTTSTGTCARIGSSKNIANENFIKLLKDPIVSTSNTQPNTRQFKSMVNWIKDIKDTNLYPNISFHYSDYFGEKPSHDTPRQLNCPDSLGTQLNTIGSYTDHIYTGADNLFPKGFTTLDQFAKNSKKGTKDSLDISPYHTKQLLLHLLNTSDVEQRRENIKNNMPYFDIADYEYKEQTFFNLFFNGNREYLTSNIFNIMTYPDVDFDEVHNPNPTTSNFEQKLNFSKGTNWDEIKLSELMSINGPGIYIHHACRPFFNEENGLRIEHKGPSLAARANSQAAADAICPSKPGVGKDYEVYVGKYRGCQTIKSIIIGNNHTELDGSFRDCENLDSVSFEETSNLEVIKGECFYNCLSLKEIFIPDNVNQIGNESTTVSGVFEDCVSLKKITLPKNLKKIHRQTFVNCKSLTEITFPNNIEFIGKNAFNKCYKLKDIKFSSEIKKIKIDPTAFSSISLDIDQPRESNTVSFGLNTIINGNASNHEDTQQLFPKFFVVKINESPLKAMGFKKKGGKQKVKKSEKQKVKKSDKQKETKKSDKQKTKKSAKQKTTKSDKQKAKKRDKQNAKKRDKQKAKKRDK